MTDSGITAATGQTVFPRIPTQQWGHRVTERGPEMSYWPRTCRRLWWRSISKAGITEAGATGTEGGGCWLDMTLTAALSSAWATRPCQRPSATPAEPPLFHQVRWCLQIYWCRKENRPKKISFNKCSFCLLFTSEGDTLAHILYESALVCLWLNIYQPLRSLWSCEGGFYYFQI